MDTALGHIKTIRLIWASVKYTIIPIQHRLNHISAGCHIFGEFLVMRGKTLSRAGAAVKLISKFPRCCSCRMRINCVFLKGLTADNTQ